MRIRHAAALALMGWYLISPPLTKDPINPVTGTGWPATDAPLSKWTILDSYDSAADCGIERDKDRMQDVQGLQKIDNEGHWSLSRSGHRDPNYAVAVAQMLAGTEAECIATDDPRLAGGVSSEHGRPPGGSR